MLPLNIAGEHVFFEDIKIEHLPIILKWYNSVDCFKFATGVDSPITLEKLTQKYAEVAICSNEFFVGIFLIRERKMIGILKGRLENKGAQTVWISSIVIDPFYQKRGFGSSSVNLLLDYLRSNYYVKFACLAVIEENIPGRAFWSKLGFTETRRIENHLKLKDKQQNVIIMNKEIG
ncbi:MAG: GNAT family N-acetyltransferase [Clostridia bacterium]|nr:GNAT family N-acetyltransferase [Clostridia bacterium]